VFKGGQEGIKAFVTYVNSQGGINGRTLRLVNADDGLDANRNRANTAALAAKVFAFVGSTSGVDYAGGEVLKETGIPDVGLALSPGRNDLPNQFSPNPVRTDVVGIGSFNWFKEKFPGAEKKAALFWHTQAISKENGDRFKRGAEKVGYEFVYTAETQPTEPNYTSHVLAMRQAGVRFIYTVMEVNSISRLTKAMEQQDFHVDVPNYGPQVYSQQFLRVAGTSAEGTLIYTPHALFEDRGALPEMALFLEWMQRAAPKTEPDLFALSAWASGRLFEQAARAAGPNLTRAGLLAELGKVDSFDANGLIAEVGPASKRSPTCFVISTVRNGAWVRVDPPSGYICDRGTYVAL
jgi:ABC-type branched-subunit amino acid transport system substrate-binding protein